MKRTIWAISAILAAGASGCAPQPPQPPMPPAPGTPQTPPARATTQPGEDPVVITVNGAPIYKSQIEEPLYKYHGLQVLYQVMELEMARQKAAQMKLTVTEQDIKDERPKSLEMLLGPQENVDYEQLLDQLLTKRGITRPTFEIWLQTNAYLRKIVDPQVKQAITEQVLREAFGTLYGETVRVRTIKLANLQEVAEAQRRLAMGQDFAVVARDMSRDAVSAPLGGVLPPFSRESRSSSQAFKDEAFSLKPGQVSEPVQAGDGYYLIKLEERMPPKAMKFEDPEVQQIVRQRVIDVMVPAAIRNARKEMAYGIEQEIQNLRDPVLRQRYIEELEARRAATQPAAPQRTPATQPATGPALSPQTAPATAPAGELRPPATMPGK